MGILQDCSDNASLVETYLGVKLKSLTIFSLSIVGAAVITTVSYWSIFGFSHWKNEMTVANKLMLAAANSPVQPAQPLAGQQGGQYVCPVHGAVGLPQFNAAGTPLCPIGGETMQLRTATIPLNGTPAAFA